MRKPRELRIAAISVVTLQHAIGGGMERYFDHGIYGTGHEPG